MQFGGSRVKSERVSRIESRGARGYGTTNGNSGSRRAIWHRDSATAGGVGSATGGVVTGAGDADVAADSVAVDGAATDSSATGGVAVDDSAEGGFATSNAATGGITADRSAAGGSAICGATTTGSTSGQHCSRRQRGGRRGGFRSRR